MPRFLCISAEAVRHRVYLGAGIALTLPGLALSDKASRNRSRNRNRTRVPNWNNRNHNVYAIKLLTKRMGLLLAVQVHRRSEEIPHVSTPINYGWYIFGSRTGPGPLRTCRVNVQCPARFIYLPCQWLRDIHAWTSANEYIRDPVRPSLQLGCCRERKLAPK